MNSNEVLLGYEVGTGEPVQLPFHHLCVTGITQLSGKTTTLEALLGRAGRTALVFLTKRGERILPEAPRVPPFFRYRWWDREDEKPFQAWRELPND